MKEFIEQLIEELEKVPTEYRHEEYNNAIWDVIRYIKKLNCNDWIPCSERLPEESLNSVIGWDEFRNRCCFVQYYNGRWQLGDDTESVKIIAWKPLPDPFKKNGV